MMHVGQITMLYTLNLYRAICQFTSIKQEEKKIKGEKAEEVLHAC